MLFFNIFFCNYLKCVKIIVKDNGLGIAHN